MPTGRTVYNSTVTSGAFENLSSDTESQHPLNEEFPISLSDINREKSEIESCNLNTEEMNGASNGIRRSEMRTPQRHNYDEPEEPRRASDDEVLSDIIREIWQETEVEASETFDIERNTPVSSLRAAANINENTDLRTHASHPNNRLQSVRATSTHRPRGSLNVVNSVPSRRGPLNDVNSVPRRRGPLNDVNSGPRRRGPLNSVDSVPRLRGSSTRGPAHGQISDFLE